MTRKLAPSSVPTGRPARKLAAWLGLVAVLLLSVLPYLHRPLLHPGGLLASASVQTLAAADICHTPDTPPAHQPAPPTGEDCPLLTMAAHIGGFLPVADIALPLAPILDGDRLAAAMTEAPAFFTARGIRARAPPAALQLPA